MTRLAACNESITSDTMGYTMVTRSGRMSIHSIHTYHYIQYDAYTPTHLHTNIYNDSNNSKIILFYVRWWQATQQKKRISSSVASNCHRLEQHHVISTLMYNKTGEVMWRILFIIIVIRAPQLKKSKFLSKIFLHKM